MTKQETSNKKIHGSSNLFVSLFQSLFSVPALIFVLAITAYQLHLINKLQQFDDTKFGFHPDSIDLTNKNDGIGYHILADFYGCDILMSKENNNETYLHELMAQAVKAMGATNLGTKVHMFDPVGATGVAILSESHMSFHTYPEYGFVAVDFFTCGPIAKPEEGLRFLKHAWGAKSVHVKLTPRGVDLKKRLDDLGLKSKPEVLVKNEKK